MKITILGSGNIGGTLGKKWSSAGHEVIFGVRRPDSAEMQAFLRDMDGQASAADLGSAITRGEVIVFALPGTVVESVVSAHAAALDGKLVIDATNRFGTAEVSNVRTIRAQAPGAKVFRAFNSLGWENFAAPQFEDIQVDLFYCGPGGDDQEVVEQLISDIGLRPVRVGDLDQLRLVDSLGELWVTLVFRQGWDRRIAFKVLAAKKIG